MRKKENLFQDDVKVGMVKVKEGLVRMELVGSTHTDLCERACLEGV